MSVPACGTRRWYWDAVRLLCRAPPPSAPKQTPASRSGHPSGVRLLTYETDFQDGFRPDLSIPGKYAVDVNIDALPTAPDIYSLDVGCRSGDFHALDYLPACSQIEVIAGASTPGTIVREGAGIRLPCEWSWNFDRQPAQDTAYSMTGPAV